MVREEGSVTGVASAAGAADAILEAADAGIGTIFCITEHIPALDMLLRELSLAAIEQMLIFHGNKSIPLAEFFRVQGSAADEHHIWNGELSGVHWLGAKMKSGRIEVHGNIGRHLGSEMTGGEIHVFGNAGDWVGGEMHNGLIYVRGRAGHLIGAAYRGSRRGMVNGTILIGGDVGNEVGHTMRRGVLAVGGNCGDFAGLNMIQASFTGFCPAAMVFKKLGVRPGNAFK